MEILIAAGFYYSGLVHLVRWWKQRSQQSLVILCYHQAAGGNLWHHLLYLRRHYRVLHLEAALEELYAPYKSGSQRRDRRTPLVLTFDDGYHDNYTHALALARELRVPITIFLIPGYIENGSRFWWQEGDHLVHRAQVSEVQATLPLTWAEVQEMEESGWVSFGAHTMHHPILAYLTDPVEVQYEVSACRVVLERQLGHPVRTFAYPVGHLEHIGENGLRAVREAGYDWAVTAIDGFNTPRTDPYLLRRVVVDVDQHWLSVAAKASGVWRFFRRLCLMPITLIRKPGEHWLDN